MKKITTCLLKISFSFYLSLGLLIFPALAEVDISPNSKNNNVMASDLESQIMIEGTGPTEATGPAVATGPQNEPGPTLPAGPQGQTGAINQTGPASLSNVNTGANSNNENAVSDRTSSQIESADNSEENNNITINLSTGKNDLSKNTQVGTVSTGDAEASLNLINVGGATFGSGSSVGAETIDGTGTFRIPENGALTRIPIPKNLINNQTGSGSSNQNLYDGKNFFTFLNQNNSAKENEITINAETGENIITENTIIQNIVTGNINLGMNLIDLSKFNNPLGIVGLDVWSFLNGLDGDLILPSNVTSGSNSENRNLINEATEIKTEQNDNSEINTGINVAATTGNNEISRNSSIGDLTTGENKVSGGVYNVTADAPVYYIINVFGRVLGHILGLNGTNVSVNEIGDELGDVPTVISNNNTGSRSDNKNSADLQNNLIAETSDHSVTNTRVNIKANTGRNKILDNTMVGDLKTGQINIIPNVVNVVGSVLDGPRRFRVSIINIFGDLKGDILSGLEAAKKSESILIANKQLQKTPLANVNTVRNPETIQNERIAITTDDQQHKPAALNISENQQRANNLTEPVIQSSNHESTTNTGFPIKPDDLTYPSIAAFLGMILEAILRRFK